MGSDKAESNLDGRTLLERAIECARATRFPIVVAHRGRPLDRLPPEIDRCTDGPGLGPIAGVLGAASRWPRSDWLVLACDLPLLTSALLLRLCELAARYPQAAAVVPETDGRLHPLSAWYAPPMIERFRQAASNGIFGLNQVLAARPRVLSEGDLVGQASGIDPVLRADAARLDWDDQDLRVELLNCNRPEDLQRASTILRDRRGPS